MPHRRNHGQAIVLEPHTDFQREGNFSCSVFTTPASPVLVLTDKLAIKPTSSRFRRSRQPEPGSYSTYQTINLFRQAKPCQLGGIGAGGPNDQVTSLGMRSISRRRTVCSGQAVGRWTRICRLVSTIRAASLIRRRRSVSNWATRQRDRRGIGGRIDHSSQ